MPNGVNADVRSMMLQALHRVGGVKYLERQAIENPNVFMSLLAKVMPTSIVSPPGSHLHFHLEAAMRVSAEAAGPGQAHSYARAAGTRCTTSIAARCAVARGIACSMYLRLHVLTHLDA